MRIIKREILLAAFFLSSLTATTTSFGSPVEACPAGGCAPCGYEVANPAAIPSANAAGVNPMINYVATVEDTRCRCYFGGFYLWAAYGIGAVDYDLKLGNTAPMLDSKSRSYLVTIADAGFNFVINYFILGAEIGYDYRSRANPMSYYNQVDVLVASASNAGVDIAAAQVFPCKIRIDLNSQHAGTADIMPGFVYDRFVAYLRLGVEQTKYTWNRRFCIPLVSIDTVTAPNLITITDADFIQSQKKSANGYRLGVGFGYAVSVHVSFHLNYVHTFGNKIDFTPTVLPTVDDIPDLNVSAPVVISSSVVQLAILNSIQPQRNEVTLGVRFRL
jgi:opacity protein-like surface antigen